MSSNASSNLNIDALESEINNNPGSYHSSFIINYGYGLPESMKTEALQVFINFVDAANVLSYRFIDGPYILMNMISEEHMHELLSSVVQLEITLPDNSNCVLNLFPVVPVRARVKIVIMGLPFMIMNRNLNGIKAQIGEMFLQLVDISISREVEGLIPTGNIFLRATTHDLKKLRQQFQLDINLLCEGYNGQAKFLECTPVDGAVHFNLQSTQNVKVFPWK